MKYAQLYNDDAAMVISRLTLDKMAAGGIYDQLGGGFARYSVDGEWHIPHFEKMLYDNGQLLSLYADAYKWCGEERYKEVVYETVDWLKREMRSPEGGFYSALDADSEGVEGKFYTWKKAEIDEILGVDAAVFNTYYGITETGNWEEEHTNVPICAINADQLATEVNMSPDEWAEFLKISKRKLYDYREQRVRPGLDHKQLTTWNALLLKGLIDAYRSLGNTHFLDLALNNATFICEQLIQENNYLLHQPRDANRAISGFLDDYAFTIEAFIPLYEARFDQKWLSIARQLADKAIALFYDPEQK